MIQNWTNAPEGIYTGAQVRTLAAAASAEIDRLRDALLGIKWQAGSTPSREVLDSIVRRAEEALDE